MVKKKCPQGHLYSKHGSQRKDTGCWRCRKCERIRAAAKIKRDPEPRRKAANAWYHRNKVQVTDRYREKLYGLSPQDYADMVTQQKGLCALCHKAPNPPPKGKGLCIDHATGKVRGLLCTPCNVAVGFYENRKGQFEIYLAKYKEAN